MTRVSGWYKRKSQVITLILAFVITGITNADTIDIVTKLSTDPALRAAVASQAQEFAGRQGIAARQTEKRTQSSSPSFAGEGGNPPPLQPQTATNKRHSAAKLLNDV
jgi:hypothetical protein